MRKQAGKNTYKQKRNGEKDEKKKSDGSILPERSNGIRHGIWRKYEHEGKRGTGNGDGNCTAGAGAATKTITDAYGEEVEIPAEVKSIVATMWPIPSVIFTVTGSGDAIKTMAQGSMEAYNISMFKVLCPGLEDLPTNCLDSSSNITFEELAKVEPDVILCNEAVEQELGRADAGDRCSSGKDEIRRVYRCTGADPYRRRNF